MRIAPRLAGAHERFSAAGWPLLPLRLLVGFGFASHGFAKLVRGVDAFAVILAAMHVPAPGITAWATSLLELVGGGALMAGVAVRPLCLAFTGIMTTALFGVHLRYGFSSIRLKALTSAGAEFGPVGYELNLLYIAALLTLALSAPSALSVARFLQTRRNKRAAPSSLSSRDGQ
ncbi:MAG TPA: DoxX family protein [Myxococcaceae bacterium]|nr:DoxX family protein [Myxococcaceae bacterium]